MKLYGADSDASLQRSLTAVDGVENGYYLTPSDSHYQFDA
jgi:hypothetical protein